MTADMRKKHPVIKGLKWHRHQYYSFFIPKEWHQFEWADDREGVIYGPDPEDPRTVFAVDVKDLGEKLQPDDLDILAEGFFGSIEQLPDCHIEERKQKVVGKGTLLTLEAKYTYTEDGRTQKRWVRVLYRDTRQVALTAQGSTPEKYDYWLPLFFEAMMTADVHNKQPELQFSD